MSYRIVNRVFSLTEQIQFYLMQRFPTRQNHDYRMDPNDDPIYDEYTSSGNNVIEEDRHWNFNIGTDFNRNSLSILEMTHLLPVQKKFINISL